ncbi:MAG: hypothetical protein LBF60_08940 [Treponema sp.]|jgi:hypothetical protein|nr:hypothetical protein [Treponema sp.]
MKEIVKRMKAKQAARKEYEPSAELSAGINEIRVKMNQIDAGEFATNCGELPQFAA